jgi:hypothetical protein
METAAKSAVNAEIGSLFCMPFVQSGGRHERDISVAVFGITLLQVCFRFASRPLQDRYFTTLFTTSYSP